jgi:hypothetical protein
MMIDLHSLPYTRNTITYRLCKLQRFLDNWLSVLVPLGVRLMPSPSAANNCLQTTAFRLPTQLGSNPVRGRYQKGRIALAPGGFLNRNCGAGYLSRHRDDFSHTEASL